MAVELLIPLIDKCIQLLRLKEEHKQQFLVEMVTPAYEQFELLHKGYLETFASYRAQIAAAEDFAEVAREVVQRLREDNLFTSNQRAKSTEFAEAIHLREPGKTNLAQGIEGFADAINRYLGARRSLIGADAAMSAHGMATQRWRNSFAEEMRNLIQADRVSDEARKKTALSHLDATVAQMQELHHEVTAHYMLIKKELLKAIRQ